MANNFYDRAGFIILSRFSSERLPGKALKLIGGTPLLAHIVKKLQQAFPTTPIVIATSMELSDNPIQKLAEELGVHVYRGSLSNVAQRFIEAAEKFQLEYAIRITGDSLYIDPVIVKRVMDEGLDRNFLLASNRKFKLYPVGQTVEVVNVKRFRQHFVDFKTDDDFEHVTDYFYRHEPIGDEVVIHHKNPDGTFRAVSLAIDTADEFEKAGKVFANLGIQNFATASYLDIYQLVRNLSI